MQCLQKHILREMKAQTSSACPNLTKTLHQGPALQNEQGISIKESLPLQS